LIIQVAETIFPLFGFGDNPARLVVILLAIAFIPSMVFAWVFEITPEGLKRDEGLDREQSISQVTGKKLDRIILVVLALALAFFAFERFVLVPARIADIVEETAQQARSEALVESYGDKSIAVLPFVNMSSDPEQEYFSDGISDELLNLLSRIPEIRVISRSSAFSYKDKDLDIPTIAAQLNVAHILEGSVRKDGNQVRINAQLIEARSDTHLWSQTFDRELENIFAVQDEISAAIIAALQERLSFRVETTPGSMAVTSTDAHDAYLRGKYLAAQRTNATIEAGVREFEKAILLDPDYALAHAELAMTLNLLKNSIHGDLTVLEAESRAIPHAERAMALNPNLAEAHAAMGILQGNREDALRYFERATIPTCTAKCRASSTHSGVTKKRFRPVKEQCDSIHCLFQQSKIM
jgi:TolB-like protein